MEDCAQNDNGNNKPNNCANADDLHHATFEEEFDFSLILCDRNPSLLQFDFDPCFSYGLPEPMIYNDNHNHNNEGIADFATSEHSDINNDNDVNVVGGDGCNIMTDAAPLNCTEDPLHPFSDPLMEVVFAELAGNNNEEDGNNVEATECCCARERKDGGEVNAANSFHSQIPKPENLVPTFFVDGQSGSIVAIHVNPLYCVGCNVLREIIHTDVEGRFVTKLDLHGRLGIISHAILETRNANGGRVFHKFDFSHRSVDQIVQFLQQYCDSRFAAGYVMQSDPHFTFFQALCVGFEWDALKEDDLSYDSPTLSPSTSDYIEQTGKWPVSPNSIAQQRERAAKITLRELEELYHLPIEEAAKRMNFCTTVVKKLCRKFGVVRWPHRKIRGLQKQMKNLEPALNSRDENEKARAEAKMRSLQEEIVRAYTAVTKSTLQF